MNNLKTIKKLSRNILILAITLGISLYLLITNGYNNKLLFIIFNIIIPFLTAISLIGFIYVEYKNSSLKILKAIFYLSTISLILLFIYIIINERIGAGHLILFLFFISLISLLTLTLLAFLLKKIKRSKNEWILFLACLLILILLIII
mgnify:FL=1|tara:strand:- start:1283 stop:1726 length:444 start_codon:yes stop_codon:yes gene_type:complete